jgi:DNA-binding protein HU-beta
LAWLILIIIKLNEENKMKTILLMTMVLIAPLASAFAANANDVVARMAEQGKISEDQAKENLNMVFAAITEELKEGQPVTVRNFGRFYTKDRAERMGRNPRTGEQIQIPAKTYPRFSSSDSLKKAMNQ